MSRIRTPQFTPQKRERLFALLETGHTVTDACIKVPISRQTVMRWAREGRQEVGTDKAEFARRYDELLNGPPESGMTEADLIRVLETQARSGNVRATQLLLERPWEKKVPAPAKADEPKPEPSLLDELAARRVANR